MTKKMSILGDLTGKMADICSKCSASVTGCKSYGLNCGPKLLRPHQPEWYGIYLVAFAH